MCTASGRCMYTAAARPVVRPSACCTPSQPVVRLPSLLHACPRLGGQARQPHMPQWYLFGLRVEGVTARRASSADPPEVIAYHHGQASKLGRPHCAAATDTPTPTPTLSARPAGARPANRPTYAQIGLLARGCLRSQCRHGRRCIDCGI